MNRYSSFDFQSCLRLSFIFFWFPNWHENEAKNKFYANNNNTLHRRRPLVNEIESSFSFKKNLVKRTFCCLLWNIRLFGYNWSYWIVGCASFSEPTGVRLWEKDYLFYNLLYTYTSWLNLIQEEERRYVFQKNVFIATDGDEYILHIEHSNDIIFIDILIGDLKNWTNIYNAAFPESTRRYFNDSFPTLLWRLMYRRWSNVVVCLSNHY